MPKSFADEIRDRLPRILIDFVTMLAVIFALYLIMPIAYVTSYVIPGVGLAGGMLIGLGALVISLMIEARAYYDLQGLSIAFASYVVAKRRGPTTAMKAQLKEALEDVGKAVSLLILIALLAPVLVIIPGIGVAVIALPLISLLIVALYGWKSWGICKEELEKIFKAFAEGLAKAFEK